MMVVSVRADDTPVVRVGVFENPPIVSIRDPAHPQGIAIDVLDYVAEHESWRVQYIPAAWGELLRLMDAGQLDVLVGIAYSEERARKYKFNRESLLGNWGIIYRRANEVILSPLDLEKKRVALMRGSIHSDVFVKSLMQGFDVAFTPIYVESYTEALEALAQRHADAAVVNRTFGALNAQKYDVVETGIIFNPIYIHYASPSGASPGLLQAIDKQLTMLKADPQSIYYRSLKHWLALPASSHWSPWLIWTTVGVLTILALVTVIAILLRHQVQRKTGELRFKTEQLQDEIDRRRQAQERLNRIAYFDGLTELPNREGFRQALAQAFDKTQRKQAWLALLFIDLDRLKHVNDDMGHDAGDLLLKKVAQRLRSSLRDQDHLSRFGGDEFVVIVQGAHAPQDAEQVATRMLRCLDAPIELGSSQVYVTASIGIALYPDDAQDPEVLLKHADTAMYQAKQQGKNRYLFYHARQSPRAVERLASETRLRQALEREELLLHYQPVVDLSDRRIVGVEALLRWNDPQRGMLLPADFLALAEDTGLIVPIGDWVLMQSCAQLRRWREQGVRDMCLCVNISSRQVGDHFIKTVDRILRESYLSPALLEFDIAESFMLTVDGKGRDTLHCLDEMGVRLTLDDFGTGYSNLNHLKQLPFKRIKIDRSLVAKISAEPEDMKIAATILMMGQGLDLQVLAEGIETERQFEFLRDRSCALGQGNLFSPAYAPEKLLTALLSSKPCH
ncbi:MAG: EAL domain-containing protein [Gammaproteobacteria bacterium]|nr:EAL domain-containing protein [Gammaproteobacteria bacterium]